MPLKREQSNRGDLNSDAEYLLLKGWNWGYINLSQTVVADFRASSIVTADCHQFLIVTHLEKRARQPLIPLVEIP